MPRSPTPLDSYVAAWRARRVERERADAAHRAAVRARLGAAVQLLVRDYGATEVVLFGSHARGEATSTSDVDLLVSGVPVGRLLVAEAAVARTLGAEVDLVEATLARPAIAERARAEGEVLHAE